METNFGLLLLVVIVIVVAAWLKFSKGKLANVIRTRLGMANDELAESLRSAEAEMIAAEGENERALNEAKSNLIVVKQERKFVEAQLTEAKNEVKQREFQSENAASIQRRDLVDEALKLQGEAQTTVESLQPLFDNLLANEKEIEANVKLLEDEKAKILADKSRFRVETRAVKTTEQVSKIVSGYNMQGYDNKRRQAEETLRRAKARAGAYKDEADKVRAAKKVKDELAALSKPAAESPQARADALMAKFAKPAASS